jgi:hypothetical protein
MTISLKHAFTSAVADSGDTTLVQPSNWNAEHDLTLATGTLLGRTTAGTGAAEEISAGTGLSLSAGSLSISTVPVANGGTGATTANAGLTGLTTLTSTATAAGTTVLTNSSTYFQFFTGTSTQTITLPVTSTLATGWTFHIINNSTGNLTVNSSGGNLVITVLPGTTAMVTCIGTTLTTAADWEYGLTDFSTATGTGSVVLSASPTLTGALAITGGTVTASTPLLDLTQTWNNAAVTFTGIKANVTDTASGASSLLMDLQTGGTSRFKVDKAGVITSSSNIISGGNFQALSSGTVSWSGRGTLTSQATGNVQIGSADAASPSAQTLSAQSVVAGTTNAAGQDFTIRGSRGTGTGAGGAIVFQTAPAGASGTTQNAATERLRITSVGEIGIGGANYGTSGQVLTSGGSGAAPSWQWTINASSTTSITSPLAWNSGSFGQYAATAQATALTINADAGTPVDGRKEVFRFKDNGTARVLTFTGGVTNGFRPVGVTMTASGSNWTYTTTISKITYFGCVYNASDSRWDVVAISQEA